MKYIDIDRRTILAGLDGNTAPTIYVIDLPEHPFDLSHLEGKLACNVVKVAVGNWHDSLTPWPAAAVYRGDAGFGGDAPTTLSELLEEAIPAIEQAERLAPASRAICGYSLGGLFALYAFTHADAFVACASLSGSVWFEGWVDYLRDLAFDGSERFAFLSIGSKEKHAAPIILHAVQDNMKECATILRGKGCMVETSIAPGGHMDHVRKRFETGLTALDARTASAVHTSMNSQFFLKRS